MIAIGRTPTIAAALLSALALAGCDAAGGSSSSRGYVSAAGSSTVYPFANVVAERLRATQPDLRTPKIESTGTGGGIERFCSGLGAGTPDIANASRRMKASEFESCRANGVTDIVELTIGIDGLALGQATNGPDLRLTQIDIYRALAAEPYGEPNTARTWADVNPALPAVAISVFGPPSTSGTYDAFKELILAEGCDANPAMQALKDSDKERHTRVCTTLRGAPYYVEQGENDNLIIQKLVANPNSLGIFGFSYLDANRARIRDVAINGVGATATSVADNSYPGSRPLYIYVKKAHVGVIPGLADYVRLFLESAGAGGPLAARGLIPLSPDALAAAQQVAADLPLLTAEQLD